MVVKDQIIKEKLEHSGIFNFADVYSFMHTWLTDNIYGVQEERYKEKVSGSSRDISFEWKASKKTTDYFKVEHTIKVEVTGLTEVEVEIDGKKKRTNKGKIIIPTRIESMEEKVENDVRAFKDEVKAYLELTGKR